MHIHEKIKKAREAANLKPGHIAKKLGIPRTTYLYWETKTPDTEKIKAVAKALGRHENYFFDTNDENTDNLTEMDKETATLNSKYIALLEKSLDEKEQDLKTYRSTVQKITSIESEITDIKTTVDVHEGKWKGYEPMILGLREFVTEELAGLKKLSREEVAVALGKKVAEQKKKVEQSHIQKG